MTWVYIMLGILIGACLNIVITVSKIEYKVTAILKTIRENE